MGDGGRLTIKLFRTRGLGNDRKRQPAIVGVMGDRAGEANRATGDKRLREDMNTNSWFRKEGESEKEKGMTHRDSVTDYGDFNVDLLEKRIQRAVRFFWTQ
jgi:hypothetical protein